MRNELLQQGAIVDMEESNTPVTENDHYDNGFSWPGKDPQVSAKFNTVGIWQNSPMGVCRWSRFFNANPHRFIRHCNK